MIPFFQDFKLDDDKAELLIAELANLAGGWGDGGTEMLKIDMMLLILASAVALF
jgi:hypothetical protein